MSLQGRPASRIEWLALARDAERSGFESLYVADHPGTCAAPFVALAAAAAVTERIRLGTCVANAGLWEPFSLAMEVATLDMLSGGRAVLGLGAGHTPAEWTMVGRSMPSPAQRVARLMEVAQTVQSILTGEAISTSGRHIELDRALLSEPRPFQKAIPLLIGGNGPTLLRFAARTADIVGVTGLGRTLPDGHTHEVDWSPTALERVFALVWSTADATGRTPEVEALVQHVEITADAEAAATRIAHAIPGTTPAELCEAPFLWIGTPGEIARQLRRSRDRWGITRYVIRQNALAAGAEVIQALDEAERTAP